MRKYIILINRNTESKGYYYNNMEVFKGSKVVNDKKWELFMTGKYNSLETVSFGS